MSDRPVYLASDAHLGAVPQAQEEAFLAWLAHTADVAGHVVINGDLFDFWFEFWWGIPRGYDRVLVLLRELVDGGMPVTLMGGNHDWWGGRYLREEIGVEFLQEPVVREYAGHRTLLAHGDGLGEGDLGYQALKLVLRGRPTRFAFGMLPPGLGTWIARRVSRTEDRWREAHRESKRAGALRDWAAARLGEAAELDLVVLGHTHTPAIEEVSPGRWYVNAGDWVHHRTYLVVGEGVPPRLLTWEG